MTVNHSALKEVARKILLDMGFLENEIQEEYWVGDSRFKKAVRVDVVGINQQKKIAVECGFTSGNKIAALQMYFDDVIVLPYFTLSFDKENYERKIRELQKELELLKDENKKLKYENEEWRMDKARFEARLFIGIFDILKQSGFHYEMANWELERWIDSKREKLVNAKLQGETNESPK